VVSAGPALSRQTQVDLARFGLVPVVGLPSATPRSLAPSSRQGEDIQVHHFSCPFLETPQDSLELEFLLLLSNFLVSWTLYTFAPAYLAHPSRCDSHRSSGASVASPATSHRPGRLATIPKKSYRAHRMRRSGRNQRSCLEPSVP